MSKASKEQSLINLRDIKKTFITSAGTFDALKGISLTVDKGEFVSVIGKSGSGKSTLMNMISGIDKPSSGEILIGERIIHSMSENQVSKWRGINVGVIFQFFQLLPTLSVIENIMLPMDFCNTFHVSQRKERAFSLLKQVGIDDQAYKFPTALSGGQQQRVAIARALSNDPPIILADEPTGNLDTATANDVFSIFNELVRSGKTLIIVTHDQDIAGQCSRTIKLADGQII
ncbi:MAG TPA: ABC transporter ATP-binding protein [Clostridia bacterium]|nr:ABC transporter ATP-binding protein [Clostridia bacterium]